MGEETKVDYESIKKEKVPYFQVTQAPGFMTGLRIYAEGEVIRWEVPENWNEEKNGKHFASHGPSTTFAPLNDAAVKMLEDHNAVLKKKNTPPLSQSAEEKARWGKMEEMFVDMMKANLEQQALIRRLLENAEDEKDKKRK